MKVELNELEPGTKYSVRVLGATSRGYPEDELLINWKHIRMPKRGDEQEGGVGELHCVRYMNNVINDYLLILCKCYSTFFYYLAIAEL